MFLALQSPGDYFFKPFLENFGQCVFIIGRWFLIVLLIRIVTQFVDCNAVCSSYKLLQEGRFTTCGLWAKISRKLLFSDPVLLATSSPWAPWSRCSLVNLCRLTFHCGCSVDWNNHSALNWSQFGAVMFAKFRSKLDLDPSLLVNQGDLDFGSL